MPYSASMGGLCQYGGTDLGRLGQAGGRNRPSCNDAHKQAAHRKRKKEAERTTIFARNPLLQEHWQANGIDGDLLTNVQAILMTHAKEAARAATDAAFLAIKQTRSNYACV